MPARVSAVPGEKYGKLALMFVMPSPVRRYTIGMYRCDCGSEVIKRVSSVHRGEIRSCGCFNGALPTKRRDVSYTVIKKLFRGSGSVRARYLALCTCGDFFSITSQAMAYTMSCGCLRNVNKGRPPRVVKIKDQSFSHAAVAAKLLEFATYPSWLIPKAVADIGEKRRINRFEEESLLEETV